MNRRSVMFSFVQAVSLVLASAVPAQGMPRVIFLNPGDPDDRGAGPYWRLVSDSMHRAAQVFGMQLEIIYAERDHLQMLRLAEEVAKRADGPDYIIIVNEKLAGPQMLNTLSQNWR